MVIVNLIAYNKKKILLATEEKQAELESEIEAKLREKILREATSSADGKAEDKNKRKRLREGKGEAKGLPMRKNNRTQVWQRLRKVLHRFSF